MLAGMLLHVIEAADPVDFSSDRRACDRRWSADKVHDVTRLVLFDLEHRGAAERAGVERLTARYRVKSGAIEPHCRAFAARVGTNHGGFERAGVGLVVIQAIGRRHVGSRF